MTRAQAGGTVWSVAVETNPFAGMMNDRRKSTGNGRESQARGVKFNGTRSGKEISPHGMLQVLTQVCSISDTGLVFHSSTEMMMGAEVGLTVETNLFGCQHEWKVLGLVIDCHLMDETEACNEEMPYKVELWFSDLPGRLKLLLSQVRGNRFHLYPPLEEDDFFGLN